MTFFNEWLELQTAESIDPLPAINLFNQEFLGGQLNLTIQQESHYLFSALSGQESETAVPCEFFSYMRPTIQTTYELQRCPQCQSPEGK